MKIAIASADEQTISKHFGHAEKYVVYSVENGQVIHRAPGRTGRRDY